MKADLKRLASMFLFEGTDNISLLQNLWENLSFCLQISETTNIFTYKLIMDCSLHQGNPY